MHPAINKRSGSRLALPLSPSSNPKLGDTFPYMRCGRNQWVRGEGMGGGMGFVMVPRPMSRIERPISPVPRRGNILSP